MANKDYLDAEGNYIKGNYIDAEGLRIVTTHWLKECLAKDNGDARFDLEAAQAATEFFNEFKDKLPFLNFIYDEKATVNFNNLVLIIGLYFNRSLFSQTDKERILCPKIARACLPKFEALLKTQIDNLKEDVKLVEIFAFYFANKKYTSFDDRDCKYDPSIAKDIETYANSSSSERFQQYIKWVDQCEVVSANNYEQKKMARCRTGNL